MDIKVKALKSEIKIREQVNTRLEKEKEELCRSSPECMIKSLNQRLDIVKANPNTQEREGKFYQQFIIDIEKTRDMKGVDRKELLEVADREFALAQEGHYISSLEKLIDESDPEALRDFLNELVGVRKKK